MYLFMRKCCKIHNLRSSNWKRGVTRIDKNGEKIAKNISYILQFIDSARFIASSLSNLVNNPSEGIQIINVKNVKLAELNISIVTFLEYTNFKDDLIEYKWLSCNKSYQRKLDEKLKENIS